MSPVPKPFTVLSLNVIAGTTSDNRGLLLQLPALNLQARTSAVTPPALEQLMERRLDPLADTGGWQHGGINE
jgi:hypothetical protein